MEQWKTIDGFEIYEISNTGKVRSIKRTVKNGQGYMSVPGGELKPQKNSNGYLRVGLYKDGICQHKFIHRLVAQYFIPNPENKPCVNHIDCNPLNNHVENLEWCTHQENMAWMKTQGRAKRTPEWFDNLHRAQEKTYKAVVGENIQTGEKIYFSKLNDVKKAGFQPSCVCHCCNGNRGVKQHKGYRWSYEEKVV